MPVALRDHVGDQVDALDDFAVLAVDRGDADGMDVFVPDQVVFAHDGLARSRCWGWVSFPFVAVLPILPG